MPSTTTTSLNPLTKISDLSVQELEGLLRRNGHQANTNGSALAESTTGKSITSKSEVFARVRVLCKDPGCESVIGGHEVMSFTTGTNYGELVAQIYGQFKQFQNGNAKARSNIRQCVWTTEHKVLHIKAEWSGANSWSGDTSITSETVVTDENCQKVLGLMLARSSMDSLAVTIGDNST